MSEAKSLVIEYDESIDIVTIEGIRYSGEFFRSFSPDGFPVGTKFKVEKRESDNVWITRIEDIGQQ